MSAEFKMKINKPVIQYDLNGVFIREFPSMGTVAEELNVCISGISQCCSGKNKTSAGFVWKFKEKGSKTKDI